MYIVNFNMCHFMIRVKFCHSSVFKYIQMLSLSHINLKFWLIPIMDYLAILVKKKKLCNSLNCRALVRISSSLSDPAGVRTQDPNIKSVVLYQLSYRISLLPLRYVLPVWWYKSSEKYLQCKLFAIFFNNICNIFHFAICINNPI